MWFNFFKYVYIKHLNFNDINIFILILKFPYINYLNMKFIRNEFCYPGCGDNSSILNLKFLSWNMIRKQRTLLTWNNYEENQYSDNNKDLEKTYKRKFKNTI